VAWAVVDIGASGFVGLVEPDGRLDGGLDGRVTLGAERVAAQRREGRGARSDGAVGAVTDLAALHERGSVRRREVGLVQAQGLAGGSDRGRHAAGLLWNDSRRYY